MPQPDNVPDIGHSEAARANETDTKPGAATMNANAITFDVRMMSSRFFSFTKSPSPAGFAWIKEMLELSRRFRSADTSGVKFD